MALRASWLVVLLTAVIVAGCRSSSEQAPSPGSATGSAGSAPSSLACTQVAEHLTATAIADSDKPGLHFIEAKDGARLLRVVAKRCGDDRWSEEAKACFLALMPADGMSHCDAKLTGEQLAKVKADMAMEAGAGKAPDAGPSDQALSPDAGVVQRPSLLGHWKVENGKDNSFVEFFGDGSFSFPGVADSGTYAWTEDGLVRLDFMAKGESKFILWEVQIDGDLMQTVITTSGYKAKWLRTSEAARTAKERADAEAERVAALKREAPSRVSVSPTGCRCAAGTTIVVSCRIQNAAQVPVLVSFSAYAQTGTMGHDARGTGTSPLSLEPGQERTQEVTTYFSASSDCLSCTNSQCRVGVTAR